MSTAINDEKFAALRNQGFTGSLSDMTLQWLQANGASSDSVNDAWAEMLASKGFNGQRNTAWFELLGSTGYDYEGQLNDRELAFWEDGGVLAP